MTRPKRRSELMKAPGEEPAFGELVSRAADMVKAPRSFLIVCGGEQTEPNYFRGFKLPTAKVVGEGYTPQRLAKEAIRLKDEDSAYDEYWCVFDRDSFPAQDFNQALKWAKENDIQAAYTNEAFELWYLLHFDYFNTGISRTLYRAKLEERLKQKYQKNSTTMFDELKDKQDTAIKNAERLLRTYAAQHNPERDNPSTTVHLLVSALRAELEVATPGASQPGAAIAFPRTATK